MMGIIPLTPGTGELKKDKEYYVAPEQIESHTGQIREPAFGVEQPTQLFRVPVEWNGYEWEAQPFRLPRGYSPERSGGS